MSELPMFPLGSVLLPGMALPLRIFEPRYRAMLEVVLAAEPRRFGVVLIERGSEVGGGDVRTDIGCSAEVRVAQPSADGSIEVLAVGVERLRVVRWLPDDPYPRAEVEPWPDLPGDEPVPQLDPLTEAVTDLAERTVQRVGGSLPAGGIDWSDEPAQRAWQIATLAPLGPLDRQRVLSAPSLVDRVALLDELLEEQRVLLEAWDGFEG